MKANNSTQPDKAPPIAESGKEVAKQTGFALSAGSKFSPQYWASRVFRPVYVRGNGRGTVQEWWARIQSAGRREAVGMGTNDRQEAARRAARLFAKVKAAGWDTALAEFSPGGVERREAAAADTFGEHLAAAVAAKAASVKSVPLRNYGQSARMLAVMVTGQDGGKGKFDYIGDGRAKWLAKVDATRTDKLTTAAMQAEIDARAKAAPDASRRRSAQRTLAKHVREAKSLFRGCEWNPFAGLKAENPAPAAYTGNLDVGALVRAGLELENSDPQLLAAVLMFAGAGLRRGEADAARWGWLDPERATLTVRAAGNFVPKTVASEAPILIDPGFAAALLRLRPEDASDESYILAPELPEPPQSSFYRYRCADLFARLQAWLRQHGLTGRCPLHDLRREFGSYIAQHSDIFTASRQLRHSSIQVTASHYAAQRRAVAPVFSAMLAAPASK